MGNTDLSGVKSVEWGINNEKLALAQFKEVTKLDVQDSGILLHHSGILGASPDGLVGEDAIIEIKCPFRLRDASAHEVVADPQYCFKGTSELRQDHPYYHQIQGQLHISKRKVAYFCVWTTKDLIIAPVKKDSEWESNIERLTTFYRTNFLSNLLN